MTRTEASVSVVIPTYNRVHYLKLAIESALLQVPPPGEVIVVDDGSTDATPELLEKFPHVVHVRRERQTSSTPAAARNAGLRVAKGEYYGAAVKPKPSTLLVETEIALVLGKDFADGRATPPPPPPPPAAGSKAKPEKKPPIRPCE